MMKKHLLLLLASLCSVLMIKGQTCLPAGTTFSDQQEVDEFITDYPGCTQIIGDVVIDGGGDITNLNGLNALKGAKTIRTNGLF